MGTRAFKPTEEQEVILDLATRSDLPSVAVQAGAGSGKTSTLRLLADAQKTRGWFMAYNKAIATDAKGKFPAHVNCTTTHSMAFREVGKKFSGRLNARRQTSKQVAADLGLEQINTEVGRISPAKMAGMLTRAMTNFYNSDQDTPQPWNIPKGWDRVPDSRQADYEKANSQIREYLTPFLDRYWQDVQSPSGHLPFTHDAYLAMWVLRNPVVGANVIYADELQDSSGRVVQLLKGQADRGVQVIGVGDTRQRIYGFRGSVEGFELFGFQEEAWLTQSFRFGPEIAGVANTLLAEIGNFRIKGVGAAGAITHLPRPDAILCRTNARCISEALDLMDQGVRVHIVGGTDALVKFAEAARDLQNDGWTSHPELAWAKSWDEVLTFAKEDELGRDLGMMVNLIENVGADVIIDRLVSTTSADKADVTVSTAHKSKGLEWDSVRLADDFPRDLDTGEACLLYVATTRARKALDIEAVTYFQ